MSKTKYDTINKDSVQYCLRFYDTKTVISVSLGHIKPKPNRADSLAKWFTIESFKTANPKRPQGKFKIKQNKLAFKTKGSKIKVTYSGIIADWNILPLSVYSSKTKRTRLETYYFVPFSK
jgi:hypothetical protein